MITRINSCLALAAVIVPALLGQGTSQAPKAKQPAPLVKQAAPTPKPATPAPKVTTAAKPVPKAAPVVVAPVLKMPNVTAFDLPNGIHVWLAPDNELPSVSGKLVFPAGSAFDPTGQSGLAALTAELLIAGGSAAKEPDEIRRLLAARSAEVTARVGPENATIRFWTLSDHASDMISMLADAVARPSFDRATFFTVKERLRRNLEHQNDGPNEVADREFVRGAFGASLIPPIQPTDVARIQRENLVDFHRRAYRPDGAQLVVSGDFEPAAMQELLKRTLGNWKPATASAPLVHRAVGLPAAALVRTAITQSSETAAVQIGYPLDKPSLETHVTLAVAAELLNGDPFETLVRPADPRVMSKFASLEARSRTLDSLPSFRILAHTRLRDTVEAIQDVLAAIDKIYKGGVTQAEFSAARSRALQRLQGEFARSRDVMALYGEAPAWGTPAEFLPKITSQIVSLQLEPFLQSIRGALVPTHRVIAIAGEIDDFRSPLDTLKLPVTPVDMRLESTPIEDPPTATQISQGAEYWRRMRSALGVDRIPIRDADIQLEGSLFTGRSDRIEQHVQWLAPGSMRVEQKTDRATISTFDGTAGWLWDGYIVSPFSPAGVRQYRGEVFRNLHWLATRNIAPPLTVYHVGSGVIRVSDVTDSVDIAINEKTGLPDTIWYIDALTGQRAEEHMLEYKNFGGIPYWSRQELYRDGLIVGEVFTTSAKFNTGLTAAQIERRPDQK